MAFRRVIRIDFHHVSKDRSAFIFRANESEKKYCWLYFIPNVHTHLPAYME